MQTQAKFAHWNVKGEDFYQLHLLFDSIAEHVEDAIDLVAERVTALGGRANGTARQVAANSSIKEYDLNVMHGMDHVRALLDHLSDVANAARQAIKQCASLGDDATADVFTEIVRAADKDIYFSTIAFAGRNYNLRPLKARTGSGGREYEGSASYY